MTQKTDEFPAIADELEPVWIVNDLGELGVQVNGRFFFLYKGDSLEYGTDDDGSPVALHDDGTPMKYRIVGKREFGECCYPMAWVTQGRREKRYMVDLTFIPGLSWGNTEDIMWRELPVPPPAAPQPEQSKICESCEGMGFCDGAGIKCADCDGNGDQKLDALTLAESTFRRYGDLHAAKPDPVKAAANYALADKMRDGIQDLQLDKHRAHHEATQAIGEHGITTTHESEK